MSERLRVNSPGDMVAAVPHVLGFHPENSLVMIVTGPRVPSARVDLPPSVEHADQTAQALVQVLNQVGVKDRSIALLAYGDQQGTEEVLDRVAGALREAGHPLSLTLVVRGDEWLETSTQITGMVPETTKTLFAAQRAYAGSAAPAASRADLADSLRGDPSGVASLLPEAQSRFTDLDRKGRLLEVTWVGSVVDRFMRDRRYPSDAESARVLAALGDGGIFGTITMACSQPDARAVVDFWTNVASRAPEQVQSPAMELAALNSYLDGNGAKALIALEMVSSPSPLSESVDLCMRNAVSPREWDRTRDQALANMQLAALRSTPPPQGKNVSPPPPRSSGFDR